MSRPRRAEPLSPEERRHAIAASVLPVLLERGSAATSRELAQAAGVAEGTLFSVFGSKHDIILAAIELHLDPEPIVRGIADIATDAPLSEALTLAANIITDSSKDAIVLLGILHTLPSDTPAAPDRHPRFMRHWLKAIATAVRDLLAHQKPGLRTTPGRATSVFIGLLMTASRPYEDGTPRLATDELVDLFLNGILQKGTDNAA